jgi:hypothetical protein
MGFLTLTVMLVLLLSFPTGFALGADLAGLPPIRNLMTFHTDIQFIAQKNKIVSLELNS